MTPSQEIFDEMKNVAKVTLTKEESIWLSAWLSYANNGSSPISATIGANRCLTDFKLIFIKKQEE